MNRYLELNKEILSMPIDEIEKLLKTENIEVNSFQSFFNFSIQDEDGNLLRNDPYGLFLCLNDIKSSISEEEGVIKKLDAITDEEINVCLSKQNIDFDDDFIEFEEEALEKLRTMTDDDIASHFNYTLICESPMEMSLNCQSNSFARGLFANIIMQYMKEHLKNEFIEDMRERNKLK